MNAVEEINAKIVKNGQIEVRLMDLHTQRVLGAQFNQAQEIWKCVGQECRSEVSIWNNKCDKCFRKRMFGPSRVCIKDRDWLCSIERRIQH
uniref:Uncharacterized protein n=1 Tax=Globisporangium ultimum (strain ATCC 200006 / CBS 805.95 / DAOM BR144) TaxID=431595 RepID=K3WW70_GLOUD